MAVARIFPEERPQSLESWAPVIPLRPDERFGADRSRAAWAAVVANAYTEHRDLVFAEARHILRDADMAEDVVQEVFTRLWRRPAAFDGERGCMRAYLRTVARGRSIDLLRSEVNRRNRQDKVAASPIEERDFAHDVVESESLRANLRVLPDHERKVVSMAYLEDRTYREVGEDLGIPEGTVKTRMRSAFSKLRDVTEV